jgi:hypothetical protein
MVYICKGYCEGMEAQTTINNKRYEAGQKFCSICGLFLYLNSPRCLCCGSLARTKSRNKGVGN